MIGQQAVEERIGALHEEYGDFDVETTERTVSSSAVDIGRSDVQAGNIVDVRVWVTRGTEVLLVREHEAPEYWIEPGGTVEPEEPSTQAAQREVAEETGIDCQLSTPRAVRRIILQDETAPERSVQLLQVFFRATYQSGAVAVQDEEIMAARWMETLPDGFYSHVGPPPEWSE